MRNFTLENYQDKLDHQVIHMDQAACYNPEFRASHMMHDYPSRKLQLARAVYKNEMDPSDYIAEIIFKQILSRQGERWQNFGECPEDLTDVMMLCREMLVKKGFVKDIVAELKAYVKKNGNHALPVAEGEKAFQAAIKGDDSAETAILLDDMTVSVTEGSAEALGAYLAKEYIAVKPVKATFLGFEYFAHGLIEEGVAQLEEVIAGFAAQNIKELIVVAPQAYYMLTRFATKFDLAVPFKVKYLVEMVDSLKIKKPSFLYIGSFNARYLINSELFENLVANHTEIKQLNHPEFLPVFSGEKRVNGLNIWQRPAGAEYVAYGIDKKFADKIADDAVDAILHSNAKQVIVFEPAALKMLQDKLDIPVVYYFEYL